MRLPSVRQTLSVAIGAFLFYSGLVFVLGDVDFEPGVASILYGTILLFIELRYNQYRWCRIMSSAMALIVIFAIVLLFIPTGPIDAPRTLLGDLFDSMR